MQFSEEWKSLFPASLVDSSPLVALGPSLGPLFFNPKPETLTGLHSFGSCFSTLLLPPPNVLLPRFIKNTTLYESGIVPKSTSWAISSCFGPQHYDNSRFELLKDGFEPLRCPNGWVIVFFPSGVNLDGVGFLVLKVEGSGLGVVDFGFHDTFFSYPMRFDHRVVRLSACRLYDCDEVGCVGFLVACTRYGAHWFRVMISGFGSRLEKPVLERVGSKLFKTCAVVCACWNPHLPSECVVLLESGELFLFDMESSKFKGKKMSVEWDGHCDFAEGGWFSCEFSWHPRVLVVANLKGVFLLDFTSGKCQPRCLLNTEVLKMSNVTEKDQFVALAKVENGGFFFTVASMHWLLLCDVRKPLMPVLRWGHNVHQPCYMTVLPLSELRSRPVSEKYAGTSEIGTAVILGSLWNNQFNLFCFGRPTSATTKSVSSKISKFCDSFYAWDQPSELRLSGNYCGCGNCILKEEFMKDDLPEWIEWQQKKEVVLGFFVLDKDLSSSLPGPGEHGGFTLVRLMSSGKLETQQYEASWKASTEVSPGCHEITPYSRDSLLCDIGGDEYKFGKRFKYLKLKYLFAHLNNNLAKLIFTNFENIPASGTPSECSNEFSEFMSEKLKSFGCAPPISHLSTSDIFSDANMPTSLYEIVSRLMWIGLPMSCLEMAFSPNKDTTLEFPNIPDQNQAPPFLLKAASPRINKRSKKIKPASTFVGPVVPLHALLVLSEISRNGYSFMTRMNDYSPDLAIVDKCKPVTCLAKELAVNNANNEQATEKVVSLDDDKDNAWDDSEPSNPGSLLLYKPSAFSDESPSLKGEDPVCQERETVISKVAQSKYLEDGKTAKIFSGLCPVELQFDSDDYTFDGEELNSYQFLKDQFSKWQSTIPEFCKQFKR